MWDILPTLMGDTVSGQQSVKSVPSAYTVVKEGVGMRYTVKDDSGRQLVVESQDIYRAGEPVIVQNGWIIGRAGKIKQPVTYQV